MSSRNTHLSATDHAQALEIYQGLLRARHAFQAGETDTAILVALASEELIGKADVKICYLCVVDEDSLEEVPVARDTGTRMLAAVEVSGIRLLDNIALQR